MHGDGVAGSKLTWTWAYVTAPCHMVPIGTVHTILYSWTLRVMSIIQEFMHWFVFYHNGFLPYTKLN